MQKEQNKPRGFSVTDSKYNQIREQAGKRGFVGRTGFSRVVSKYLLWLVDRDAKNLKRKTDGGLK